MNIENFLEITAPIFNALKGLNFFIAGGALRDFANDEQPKDYDVFFNNDSDSRDALKRLGVSPFAKSNEVATVVEVNGLQVNIIHKRNFQTAAEIITGLDFKCVCACVDQDGNFRSNHYFLSHARAKKLEIQNLTTPFSTFERVARFSRRGYSIEKDELKKIAKELIENCEVDFDAY